MNHKPPVIAVVTAALISLVALVWLSFGVIIMAGLHPTMHFETTMGRTMSILGILCAAGLLTLLFLAFRHIRFAYWLLVAGLSLIAVLSITDEVGAADLASLGITLTALACLVAGRRWFLQK
jgi:hypothetical protein